MTTQSNKPRQPAYIAYHVRDGRDKPFFTRIGAAWLNADEKGYSILLDVVPLDGRITLRLLEETAS